MLSAYRHLFTKEHDKHGRNYSVSADHGVDFSSIYHQVNAPHRLHIPSGLGTLCAHLYLLVEQICYVRTYVETFRMLI